MKTTLLDKTNLYLVMLADPQLSHGDKVVAAWILLFHHNSRSGLCIPKTETIGKAIGMRRENVSRHISNLVKAGYLLVQRRFNSSNSYDFVWSRGTREALNEIRDRLKDENIDVTVSSAANGRCHHGGVSESPQTM
jgi:DNA-binding transcriptional ArsR family regulator